MLMSKILIFLKKR